ncbi:MAG TPA: GldG family protein [Aggregatilineaceae bacterium]|nr:GldG family protein [Aggregatilineaceae bacterium]
MKPPFTRSDVAAGAIILGTAALVLGVLLFLFTGELSIWVFACAVVAAAGIGLWMWWAPGELQAWLAGRQSRQGTTSILVTLLFIGFVVSIYILADRANSTVDLTSVQRYTLDRQTLDTIDRLQERDFRVRIVGFFSRYKLREQETADLLLRQYEAAGEGSVEVQYIDPDEEPGLASRYSYSSDYDGQLFLNILDENGDPKTRPVTLSDGTTGYRYITLVLGDVSERDITTGLKTVASAGLFNIYFTTGHGERDLQQVGDEGISRLGTSLDDQGIAVTALNLSEVDRIPDDASAVLIIGAWSPFTEAEVAVLDEYIQRGGRLAIFADPPLVESSIVSGDNVNTFLQEDDPLHTYLWDEFGINVQDQLLIENDPNYQNGSNWFPIVAAIAPHEKIMNGARDIPIVMSFARAMSVTSNPDERQGKYALTPLLFSSEQSFGMSPIRFLSTQTITYDPSTDVIGPVTVGVTLQRTLESQLEIQPRVVVIGDSDVLKNAYVVQYAGNVILWNDVIDWLTGFAEVISFNPISDPSLLSLNISEQDRTTVSYITMLILPGLILVVGVGVWWYRQR